MLSALSHWPIFNSTHGSKLCFRSRSSRLLLTQTLFPTGDYEVSVHDRSSHPYDCLSPNCVSQWKLDTGPSAG